MKSVLFTKYAIAASIAVAAITALAVTGGKHDIPPVDKQQMSTPKAAATPSDNPLDDLAPPDDVPTSKAAPVKQVALREPTTESGVPIDVIRSAINDARDPLDRAFPVQTWKEVNTYTRKINDETVVIIEFHATYHLTPKDEQYVGTTPADFAHGAKFDKDVFEKDGTIALVKRGHDWYIYKG